MASTKTTESKIKKMTVNEEIRDTDTTGLFVRHRATKIAFYYSHLSPVTGKRRNTSVGTFGNITLEQARTAAKHFAAEVLKGNDPADMKQETREKSKSLKQKTLDWSLDHDFKELTPADHYDKAVKTIRREFREWLHVDMREIKEIELNKWKLKPAQQKRKNSIINRYMNDLRGALTKAVSAGYIDATPMLDVKPLTRIFHKVAVTPNLAAQF